MADSSLAAALAGDDGCDALLPQVSAQPIGVVTLVGGKAMDAAWGLGQ